MNPIDEQRDEIAARLIAAGEAQGTIAIKLGCAKKTVKIIAERLGILDNLMQNGKMNKKASLGWQRKFNPCDSGKVR